MKNGFDVKVLFEKFRKKITNEMLCWCEESSNIEDYIVDEGYDHAVVIFLINIEKCTNNEYALEATSKDKYIPDTDISYFDAIITRNSDGVQFKGQICEELGEWDKFTNN